MATIRITAPFVAKEHSAKSRLVGEVLAQTFLGHIFLQRQASGLFQPHPGDATNTNIAFALESGHNYTIANEPTNLVEVTDQETYIEINVLGTPTAIQLAPGASYGLSISGGVYVLDTAKTANPVMKIIELAGRGVVYGSTTSNTNTSGMVGDTNPRVIAQILPAASA